MQSSSLAATHLRLFSKCFVPFWQHLYASLTVHTRRHLSTTSALSLNQKWRKAKGLPLNPNTCGPLTDKKDYSFLDGRTTPYGMGQKERILKQQEIAQRIIDLTAEIDFAVERHKKLQIEEQENRKQIIGSKLKVKGGRLLKQEVAE